MLLGRCEFGREDYSLNIINIPVDQETVTSNDSVDGTDHHSRALNTAQHSANESILPEKRTGRQKKTDIDQLTLFDE